MNPLQSNSVWRLISKADCPSPWEAHIHRPHGNSGILPSRSDPPFDGEMPKKSFHSRNTIDQLHPGSYPG
jgi:hypothetical protein